MLAQFINESIFHSIKCFDACIFFTFYNNSYKNPAGFSFNFIHSKSNTHLFLAFTENFESRYVSHVIDVLFFCWKLCRCWCLFICSYGQMTSKQMYLLTSTSVVRKHLYVFVTWQLRAKNCASHYILFLN